MATFHTENHPNGLLFTIKMCDQFIDLDQEGVLQLRRCHSNRLTTCEIAKSIITYFSKEYENKSLFEKWHASIYQGEIDKSWMQLFLKTYNSNYDDWNTLVEKLQDAGLEHMGSINSYRREWRRMNSSSIDNTLEMIKDKGKNSLVIIKMTRIRPLSLKNLAAEKISQLVGDQQGLNLIKEQIPHVCIDTIRGCLNADKIKLDNNTNC